METDTVEESLDRDIRERAEQIEKFVAELKENGFTWVGNDETPPKIVVSHRFCGEMIGEYHPLEFEEIKRDAINHTSCRRARRRRGSA